MQQAELVSRGRESFARRAWADAFESLSRADQATPLEADELELLATSAYMLGRDADHVRALERGHRAYLDAGKIPRAVYCAYWIGHNLMLRGEAGPATGWFGRGQRPLEHAGQDCAERGYLLIPDLVSHAIAGEHEAGYATAIEVAEIGTRFGGRCCPRTSRSRWPPARSGSARRLSRARGDLPCSSERHAPGDVRASARSTGIGRRQSRGRSCFAP
jgi:hypothetical protein